jgi:Tfp pilus assembly protein PilN
MKTRMADFDLNLSTHPFPAYRLANAAVACGLALLVAVSLWQASGFIRYSKLAQSIRSEAQDSRVEAEALGKRVRELEARLDRPDSTAKLNEIGFLNHLILRKSFSWTKLFAVLEDMVPEDVHFTTISPNVAADGSVTLNLGIRARSMTGVAEFLKRVEQSPLFKKLDVRVEEQKDSASRDLEVTLSAVYYPQKDGQ